jgi:hypothetical protein
MDPALLVQNAARKRGKARERRRAADGQSGRKWWRCERRRAVYGEHVLVSPGNAAVPCISSASRSAKLCLATALVAFSSGVELCAEQHHELVTVRPLLV